MRDSIPVVADIISSVAILVTLFFLIREKKIQNKIISTPQHVTKFYSEYLPFFHINSDSENTKKYSTQITEFKTFVEFYYSDKDEFRKECCGILEEMDDIIVSKNMAKYNDLANKKDSIKKIIEKKYNVK